MPWKLVSPPLTLLCATGQAPYTNTLTSRGALTFTSGIVKSVSVVSVADFAITHVVPGVFYRGATPETPLADGSHSGFRVAVKLFVYALRPGAATVTASGGWGASNSSKVALGAGENVVAVDLIAAADQISLWWPNGAGKQPLYNLSASVAADGGALAPVTAQRRIGFRTFAIFTGDGIDSLFFFFAQEIQDFVAKEVLSCTATHRCHPQQHGCALETLTNGMNFRVNGANVFARGANMVPMEELVRHTRVLPSR